MIDYVLCPSSSLFDQTQCIWILTEKQIIFNQIPCFLDRIQVGGHNFALQAFCNVFIENVWKIEHLFTDWRDVLPPKVKLLIFIDNMGDWSIVHSSGKRYITMFHPMSILSNKCSKIVTLMETASNVVGSTNRSMRATNQETSVHPYMLFSLSARDKINKRTAFRVWKAHLSPNGRRITEIMQGLWNLLQL